MAPRTAVVSNLDENLADIRRLVPLRDLIESECPNRATKARSGVLRSFCPHCGSEASLFATDAEYRCDACHAAGDAIEWYAALHGERYQEALAHLACRAKDAGLYESLKRRIADAQLAMDAARRWYHELFLATPAAVDYWTGRGFSMELAAREVIGFAPRDSRLFYDAMRAAQIPRAALLDAGLLMLGEKGPYPFFRDRLLIPISDTEDVHCVAFGARTISDAPAAEGMIRPKYINSRSTLLYHKGSTFYGFGAARERIAATRSALIVEGFFTVLRCREGGLTHVIATNGTSLTTMQASLLAATITGGRPNVKGTAVLLYDEGAEEQSFEAARRLLTAGLQVAVPRMPAGSDDPDTLARRDGFDALRTVLRDAPSAMQALCEYRLSQLDRFGLRERRLLVAELFDLLSQARSRWARADGLARLKEWFGIDPEAARRLLEQMASPL